jgi:hypothetical protein
VLPPEILPATVEDAISFHRGMRRSAATSIAAYGTGVVVTYSGTNGTSSSPTCDRIITGYDSQGGNVIFTIDAFQATGGFVFAAGTASVGSMTARRIRLIVGSFIIVAMNASTEEFWRAVETLRDQRRAGAEEYVLSAEKSRRYNATPNELAHSQQGDEVDNVRGRTVAASGS